MSFDQIAWALSGLYSEPSFGRFRPFLSVDVVVWTEAVEEMAVIDKSVLSSDMFCEIRYAPYWNLPIKPLSKSERPHSAASSGVFTSVKVLYNHSQNCSPVNESSCTLTASQILPFSAKLTIPPSFSDDQPIIRLTHHFPDSLHSHPLYSLSSIDSLFPGGQPL